MITGTFRKPHRIKKKRPIFKNRLFWLGILTSIFIISVFYFLFFSEIFQIEKITIAGEKEVSREGIRLVVAKNIEKKILFFRTKSIFLINLSKMKEDILNDCPRIAEVIVERRFPDALNVSIKKRTEIAIWCQEGQCFLLDQEGVIFEETTLEEEFIKIVNQRNITPPAPGERVIDKDYLEDILKIQEKLNEEIKIETKEFIVLLDRLRIKTTDDWEIYLDPQGDIEWQLTKLNLVLFEEIPSERRKDLEYIELRFGNFAPYKYQQGESFNTIDED